MASSEELPVVRDEEHLVSLMLPVGERQRSLIHRYVGGAIYLTEYLGEVGEHYEMPPCIRWVVPDKVFQRAVKMQFILGENRGEFRSQHEYLVTEIGLATARGQSVMAK